MMAFKQALIYTASIAIIAYIYLKQLKASCLLKIGFPTESQPNTFVTSYNLGKVCLICPVELVYPILFPFQRDMYFLLNRPFQKDSCQIKNLLFKSSSRKYCSNSIKISKTCLELLWESTFEQFLFIIIHWVWGKTPYLWYGVGLALKALMLPWTAMMWLHFQV